MALRPLLQQCHASRFRCQAEDFADEDETPVAVYEEDELRPLLQQCHAGDGPPKVSVLLEQIARGVSELLQKRAEVALLEEGVETTVQLCELHPDDFVGLRLPALLKTRLRRVRERGGKIPPDLLDRHGVPGVELSESP